MEVNAVGNFLDMKKFVSKKNGKSYCFVGFYSADGETVSMFCPDRLVEKFSKHKRFDEINVTCSVGYDKERMQVRYSLLDLID